MCCSSWDRLACKGLTVGSSNKAPRMQLSAAAAAAKPSTPRASRNKHVRILSNQLNNQSLQFPKWPVEHGNEFSPPF